jgi:hypothetical protein
MTNNPTATVWPCTSAEYHDDGRNSVSHSELECLTQSPRLYEGRYLTGEFPRKESGALDLGIALHSFVLDEEPAFILIPESALSASGSKAGAKWLDFKAANPGKSFLKQEEFDLLQAMCEAIHEHEAASYLLCDTEGQNEYTIKWLCDGSNMTRRARLDRLTPSCIIDLKSCRSCDPQAFSRAAAEYGYHRQASYYQDAVEALRGDRPPVLFVAVESEAPFDCAVLQLDEPFVAHGRVENMRDLLRLSDCRNSGVWRRPGHGEVITIPGPKWAFDSSWEI